MVSKANLKSKSGMNGHPRAALDTRIEPPDSPMNWGGFYEFKTIKYSLQERLMSKRWLPPQNVPDTEKSSSQKPSHPFTWLIRHPKNRERAINSEFFSKSATRGPLEKNRSQSSKQFIYRLIILFWISSPLPVFWVPNEPSKHMGWVLAWWFFSLWNIYFGRPLFFWRFFPFFFWGAFLLISWSWSL